MKTKPSKQSDILAKVQALYNKNPRMAKAIGTGVIEKKNYTEADGIPLPEGHVIREMSGLPCLPFNKVVQVAGKPDTGKSTCAGETIALAQKAGMKVILWDTEDKFDAIRFEKEFGGNAEEIFFVSSNEIRMGAQLVKDYINVIKEGEPEAKILVVQDSVGGGLARSDSDRNLADERSGQPGQAAKENGEAIRHWVGMFNKYPDSICVFLVNQTYAKIGFMQKGDKAKGGDGIEFFSSLIVFLKRIKVLTKVVNKKKMKYGIITRATVTKNHLSQGKMSVYQMDFEITSAGTSVSKAEVSEDEAEGDEE